MSTFPQFIEYANTIAAELSLLAESGSRQLVSADTGDETAAFIVATGKEEAAILKLVIDRMEHMPEVVAYREKNKQRTEADIVALAQPERN
jgi:hypothetical protein